MKGNFAAHRDCRSIVCLFFCFFFFFPTTFSLSVFLRVLRDFTCRIAFCREISRGQRTATTSSSVDTSRLQLRRRFCYRFDQVNHPLLYQKLLEYNILIRTVDSIEVMQKMDHGSNVAAQSNAAAAAATATATATAGAQLLTGKQEHCTFSRDLFLIIADCFVYFSDLKRELISMQVQSEIAELNSPTALRRFGAPFRSEFGEIPPLDSELPILRFIFVHHVRKFPFLDQAREKEFWQDKLQVFLESFANKHISSSEDRHEETKRRKLAKKCEKLVELMMVSGIPTASGYEERIRFSEMEVVDRGANEQGLLVNVPEGNAINSWDVNVAGVRTTLTRRHVRYHQHAVCLIFLVCGLC